MTRAAIEMAVGIVEDAFVGTVDQEGEEDELDDLSLPCVDVVHICGPTHDSLL